MKGTQQMTLARSSILVAASLLLSSLAYANTAQEQACVARVSQLAGVPVNAISVVSASGGWFGLTNLSVQLSFPNGTATCRVDRQNVVQDVQLFGATGAPIAGGVQDLRTACAREAERVWNIGTGRATTTDAQPNDTGMYEVTVVADGRQGRCTVTSRGVVSTFESR